jgi:dUTP pyrophosphatase
MILHNDLLKEYLSNESPLVEDVCSEAIQPNGVELTVERVYKLDSAGTLGVDNDDRVIPEGIEIKPDEEGWWNLQAGCYRVRLMETVNIPLDIFALARPRSSLLRSGVLLGTALWDSGYSGKSEVLLIVSNNNGFKLQRGARILQLIFFLMGEEVNEGYNGKYQGENL